MSGPYHASVDVNKRCGEIIIFILYYCHQPGRFLKIRGSQAQLLTHRNRDVISFNLSVDPAQKDRLRIS